MMSRTADKCNVKVTVTVKDAAEMKAALVNLFRQVMNDEMLVIELEEEEYGEEETGYSNVQGLSADVIE